MGEEKHNQFCQKNYGSKTYLIYEEVDIGLLDEISRQMLCNNTIPGFLPLSEERSDGRVRLRYDITGLEPLRVRMEEPFTKKESTALLQVLLSCIFRAEEMMLDPAQLMWEEAFIYIDTEEEIVQMLCLPLKNVQERTSVFDFLRRFIMRATYDPTEDRSYVADLLGILNCPECSVRSFYNRLEELRQIEKEPCMPSSALQNLLDEEIPAGPAHSRVREKIRIRAQTEFSVGTHSRVREKIVTPPMSTLRTAGTKQIAVPQDASMQQATADIAKAGTPESQNGAKKAARLSFPASERIRLLIHLFTHFSRENWVRYRNGTYARKNAPERATREESLPSDSEDRRPQPARTPKSAFTSSISAGTTLLQSPDKVAHGAYLVRQKTGERIAIAQDLFRIGTQAAYADYVVHGNTAVSRNHATIQRDGALYFLIDNHATNHSYVDEVLLSPGEPTVLYHGATIRLADEMFLFFNEETGD